MPWNAELLNSYPKQNWSCLQGLCKCLPRLHSPRQPMLLGCTPFTPRCDLGMTICWGLSEVWTCRLWCVGPYAWGSSWGMTGLGVERRERLHAVQERDWWPGANFSHATIFQERILRSLRILPFNLGYHIAINLLFAKVGGYNFI